MLLNQLISASSFARTLADSVALTRPLRVALHVLQFWLFTCSASSKLSGVQK